MPAAQACERVRVKPPSGISNPAGLEWGATPPAQARGRVKLPFLLVVQRACKGRLVRPGCSVPLVTPM